MKELFVMCYGSCAAQSSDNVVKVRSGQVRPAGQLYNCFLHAAEIDK